MPLLEVEKLSYEVAGRRVLRRLSFGADAGEVLAVVGPNGAGKSTLARALGGELGGVRGRVRIAGRVVGPGRPAPIVGRPVSVHSACGVERWIRWAAHSAGPVVVLDDPTGALDAARSRRVLDAGRGLASTGRVVIVTTHDLTLAGAVSDRVLLLAAGRLLADGPAAHVLTPALLELAFGRPFDVVVHPSCPYPIVLPPPGRGSWCEAPGDPRPGLALVARDGALVG